MYVITKDTGLNNRVQYNETTGCNHYTTNCNNSTTVCSAHLQFGHKQTQSRCSHRNNCAPEVQHSVRTSHSESTQVSYLNK